MLPVLLLALTGIDEGLPIASSVLMMLETIWYVLFNLFTVKPLMLVDLLEAARFHRDQKQGKFPSSCQIRLVPLELVIFANF